jgi:TATA-box binding protein (TBP) (component of TFIID and TFIIIB)
MVLAQELPKQASIKIRSNAKIKPKSTGRKNAKAPKKKVELVRCVLTTEPTMQPPETMIAEFATMIETLKGCQQFLIDHKIGISTSTLVCKLGSTIDVYTLARKIKLTEDGIASVKYGERNCVATNRTIVYIKPKKKASTKVFYNQVTILMRPTKNKNRNYMNIKLFQNGSLQITGCKDMTDFYDVVDCLMKILTKPNKVVQAQTGEIKYFTYATNPEKVSLSNVSVSMINSDYKLGYKIDRFSLYSILKNVHHMRSDDKDIGYVECKHATNRGRSCVDIKHSYDADHKTSIFVFHTGAIIITGVKSLPQIIEAYKYITNILKRYHNQIKVVDIPAADIESALDDFFAKNPNNANPAPIQRENEIEARNGEVQHGAQMPMITV